MQATEGVSHVVEPDELASLAQIDGLGSKCTKSSRPQIAALAGIKVSARLLLRFRVGQDVVASILKLECEQPPGHLL